MPKIKKRIKSPPLYIQKWLREAPIKEIAFWSDLYDKGGEEYFEKIIDARIDGIKNAIFRIPETDSTLNVQKALFRGGALELLNMKLMVRWARSEFEKRISVEK